MLPKKKIYGIAGVAIVTGSLLFYYVSIERTNSQVKTLAASSQAAISSGDYVKAYNDYLEFAKLNKPQSQQDIVKAVNDHLQETLTGMVKQKQFDQALQLISFSEKAFPPVAETMIKKESEIKALDASQKAYDDGVKYVDDKKYNEALNAFSKVIKEDTDNYSNVEKKKAEISDLVFNDDIQQAKQLGDQQQFDDALIAVGKALDIKKDDVNAQQLKTQLEANKQAAIEAQQKAAAQQKAKEEKQQQINAKIQQLYSQLSKDAPIKLTGNYKVDLAALDNELRRLKDGENDYVRGSEERRKVLEKEIDVGNFEEKLIDGMQKILQSEAQ